MGGWFKDYVFFPLNKNHIGKKKFIYFNTLITFLLIGLWHGPKWTFVAWGGLHGLLLILDRETEEKRAFFAAKWNLNKYPVLLRCFQIFITFSLMSLISVFFRAESMGAAFHVLKEMFSFSQENYFHFKDIRALMEHEQHFWEFCLVIASIFVMEVLHYFQSKNNLLQKFKKTPFYIRWGVYPAACFVLILVGKFYAKEFVYFQF